MTTFAESSTFFACSRSSGSWATLVAIGVIASAIWSVRSFAGTVLPPGSSFSVTLPPVDLERVNALLQDWGEPAYRGRQAYEAATRGLAAEWGDVTALPVSLRRRLQSEAP